MLKVITTLLLTTLFAIVLFSFRMEPVDGPDGYTISKGRKIFMNKCTSCHKLSSVDGIGPGLENITQRQTQQQIIMWAINHKERVDVGDTYGQDLYKKYKYYVPTKSGLNEITAGYVYDFLYSLDNDGM